MTDRLSGRRYRHHAGAGYNVVHCRECQEPMNFIYDESIRDTCRECGGEAKANYKKKEQVQRANKRKG